MLANLDAAQLEWRVVAHNSRDPTAIQEIKDGVDFHTDNQIRFKLPGWQVAGNGSDAADAGRLIAKIFLFRAIFRGSAYAYSVDNDFKHLGGQKFWQNIIDKFYEKYEGIYHYHIKLLQEAANTGQVVSESGRIYKFEMVKDYKGNYKLPETDIVNYPVQGFAADLMTLIRVSAYNRLREQREKGTVLFVNTVHDSIVLDINGGIRDAVEAGRIVRSSFRDCPMNFQKLYGSELLVPMDSDLKVGINNKWMHKIKL